MAGRCSVWPTTAHPSTFSHHRALCTLTSTCTSGAAVNAKKEILHVYRKKDLPKMFWMEGVSSQKELPMYSFGWMLSRAQTRYQFTVRKAVKCQCNRTLNMKAKSDQRKAKSQSVDWCSLYLSTCIQSSLPCSRTPRTVTAAANESDPTYWCFQTLKNLDQKFLWPDSVLADVAVHNGIWQPRFVLIEWTNKPKI